MHRLSENQGVPTIASATGEAFLNNPVLHQEVFGPYSLVYHVVKTRMSCWKLFVTSKGN